MAMGRKPRVELTPEQRKDAASRAVKYRHYWGLSQEQFAIEIGTHPSVVAGIERSSPFASSKFVAACLALGLATEPRDEAARRYRASRARQQATLDAMTTERSRSTEPAPVQVDDKEYPFE